jgi:hypothetical protein
LNAIAEAAKEQGQPLPPFTVHGMGSARSTKTADGRFITFKRRLVPAAQAEIDGVEWTLWCEQDDLPVAVAAFRRPLLPRPDHVAVSLSLLKGWLLDRWTPAEAKIALQKHPRARALEEPLASRESGR